MNQSSQKSIDDFSKERIDYGRQDTITTQERFQVWLTDIYNKIIPLSITTFSSSSFLSSTTSSTSTTSSSSTSTDTSVTPLLPSCTKFFNIITVNNNGADTKLDIHVNQQNFPAQTLLLKSGEKQQISDVLAMDVSKIEFKFYTDGSTSTEKESSLTKETLKEITTKDRLKNENKTNIDTKQNSLTPVTLKHREFTIPISSSTDISSFFTSIPESPMNSTHPCSFSSSFVRSPFSSHYPVSFPPQTLFDEDHHHCFSSSEDVPVFRSTSISSPKYSSFSTETEPSFFMPRDIETEQCATDPFSQIQQQYLSELQYEKQTSKEKEKERKKEQLQRTIVFTF